MPHDEDTPPAQSPESDVVETDEVYLVQRMYAEAYGGLLPHPQHLERFEELLPGTTDRLLTMVEHQATHRQEMEKRELTIESRNSMWGLICGWTIGMATIVGAVACILYGHAFSGAFLGTAGLGSLVGVFVYGSRRQQRTDETMSEASEAAGRLG